MLNFRPYIGACFDCQEIIAIEGIPETNVLYRARALRSALKGKIGSIFEFDEAKLFARQENFDILEMIAQQSRKPVCLKCGGENHSKIGLPQVEKGKNLTDVELTATSVKHPGCRGELHVNGSRSTRLAVAAKTQYFDIYGQYLTTIHGSAGI